MSSTAEDSADWWPDGDSDGDRVPVSALEHHAYCPRQAALIHLENIFTDDANTMLGTLAHERVDRPGIRATAAPGTQQHYAVPIWSATLGLRGRCDVVEVGDGFAVPIEHKIGEYHPGGPADIQVAAQVLCLREMLDLDVPHGEIFTHADRRRHRVHLTTELTDTVRTTIRDLRAVLRRGQPPPPPPQPGSRCGRCSIRDDCLPNALTSPAADLTQPRQLGTWDD